MQKNLVIFEGYDGAGKSTLIDAVRAVLEPSTVQVVGRKKERELLGISRVIEHKDLRPHPDVEVLLRIGLEMERTHVVARALQSHDLVCCDRGVISLVCWFDYLGVSREPYEPLLAKISEYYRGSVTFVCTADFETCWTRVAGRPDPSLKERLGVDTNRRFFSLYQATVAHYAESGFDVVPIDTVGLDIAESVSEVVRALVARGLWLPIEQS